MIKLYIGIDSHKASNSVAFAFAGTKPPEFFGKLSADIRRFQGSLYKILRKYNLKKDEIKLCYEAGPTGFVLARRLIGLGYDCIVAAPSLMPVKSGDKLKTDKRDAKKIAKLLRSGDLTPVHIPDPNDEVIRDVCRGRTDAVNERQRCQKQLGAFLLRNGYHYTGSTRWTQKHMTYLRDLVLPDPAQKLVREEYLQRIDFMTQQIDRMEDQMLDLRQGWQRRPLVEALIGFRGFRDVASMIIISEIGDFTRFDHPKKLMAYLGLVPGEDSSGSKRRQGPITKCGNSHARWILVECAGSYNMPAKVGRELSDRQEGLSQEVKALSWKVQNRLCKRWYRLSMRGVLFNKIRVAVARELSSYIWDLSKIVY